MKNLKAFLSLFGLLILFLLSSCAGFPKPILEGKPGTCAIKTVTPDKEFFLQECNCDNVDSIVKYLQSKSKNFKYEAKYY